MSLSKFDEIKNLSKTELTEELLTLKKQLFDLRIKKSTRQEIKPHLFKHIKHRISQINYFINTKEINK
jgi:large subunit ribosomal protein L29